MTIFLRWLTFGSLVASVACSTVSASAAPTDCATPIKTELASLCGGFAGSTLKPDVGGVPGIPPIAPIPCGGGGPAREVVFSVTTGRAAQKPAPTRDGMTLDPAYAAWTPVSSADLTCPNLVSLVYNSPAIAAAPAPPPQQAVQPSGLNPAKLLNLHKLITSTGDRPSPSTALAAVRAYRSQTAADGGTFEEKVSSQATGAFDGAVAETLQILGQIVADRASAQAYTLIKSRLTELLGCQENDSSTAGFNATCAVLMPLRIQDIAMSRDALLAALVSDGLAIIEKNNAFKTAMGPILGGVAASAIIPLVARPRAILEDSAVREIVDALVTYADKALPANGNPLTPEQEVVAVGVAAYLQCITPGTAVDLTKLLASCDVGGNVTRLAGANLAIIPAASALAHDLVFIGTPTPKGSDLRPRLIRAADTLFDTSCMLLRGGGLTPLAAADPGASLTVRLPPVAALPAPPGPPASAPTLACNPPVGATIANPQDALALVQPIVDEAIDRDTNAMIASIVKALQYVDSTLVAKSHRRAFVFLGGLLDYAATYTSASNATGTGTSASTANSDLHDQRTKILESLTQEMTDRTGREGEVVVSLGGSLRLIAGARIGLATKGAAFLGPLSLPLGVAITQIPGTDGCHCGVHLEIDAVDLGQYLSWNNGPSVATPQVQDALSPSITVGVAFGPTMPFVIGGTIGYSPSFAFDTSRPDAKGTLNLGVVLGVNVPLIDAN